MTHTLAESSAESMLIEAQRMEDTSPDKAIELYKSVTHSTTTSEKDKELAIYNVAKLYAKQGAGADLSLLMQSIRPFFDTMSKAKTAKIVRTVIDLVSEYPGNEKLQIELCRESIQWCKDTNRSYLRQRIETRLFAVKEYQPALSGETTLLSEVKRLDDKPLLVEIQLLESRIHHALKNIPKARGALTAARTNGNSIYCPPKLQAEIDMMSGILHAEEHDYKTAYSYFFESFEGYNSLDDPLAIQALKYMLLSKIMTHSPEDVATIVQGKTALRYAGRDVDAMRAVAKAHSERDLRAFENATKEFIKELTHDPIIHTHLSELYNTLLEQANVTQIRTFNQYPHGSGLTSEEFNGAHSSPQILSNMILDKKFEGILDQGLGTLVVYDNQAIDKTYPTSLATIQTLSRVVDILYGKASKLS